MTKHEEVVLRTGGQQGKTRSLELYRLAQSKDRHEDAVMDKATENSIRRHKARVWKLSNGRWKASFRRCVAKAMLECMRRDGYPPMMTGGHQEYPVPGQVKLKPMQPGSQE